MRRSRIRTGKKNDVVSKPISNQRPKTAHLPEHPKQATAIFSIVDEHGSMPTVFIEMAQKSEDDCARTDGKEAEAVGRPQGRG